MRAPDRIRSISPPLIDMINSHAERLEHQGAQVTSLGPGVPGFPIVTRAQESCSAGSEALCFL